MIIPYHCGQITYSKYLDFRKEEDVYLLLNDDEQEERIEEHLAAAIGHIVGDCSDIVFNHPEDDINGLIDVGFILPIGGKISTIRIYAHILSLLRWFHVDLEEGKNIIDGSYFIDYKGDRYYVDPDLLNRHFGFDVGRTYSTGEVIEIKSLERELKLLKASGRMDQDGSIEFTLTLKIMAILLRKRGEKLSPNYKERELFLRQRATHFQDLPLDAVLGVRFFFIHILESYETTQTLLLRSRVNLNRHQAQKKEWPLERRQQKNSSLLKIWLETKQSI